MSRKITIVDIGPAPKANLNDQLQWFGSSLGLFGLRDKDKSCFRIFITLMSTAKSKKQISSDEIAEKLGLTRGTVVHHLNKLMDAGIVIKERKGYILRRDSIEATIKEINHDINRSIEELTLIAQNLDKALGI